MSTRRPHSIVAGVVELGRAEELLAGEKDGAAGPRMEVRFETGETGILDMTVRRSAVWAEVLESQRAASEPVYVELDPRTSEIIELLLPSTLYVERIKPADEQKGDLVVDLVISHARHYLRRTNRDFTRLKRALEAALEKQTPVLVTETRDEHEIIDVQPVGKSSGRGK